MVTRTFGRIRSSGHDFVKDGALLGPGILLQRMCCRPQYRKRLACVLDYSQWVRKLAELLVILDILTHVCRLWIVIPSLIVFRLGKDITASLNVADNTSKKVKSRKTQ